MLKAIILDDELHGRENLRNQLGEHCLSISVTGVFGDTATARAFLAENEVDVLFLDIMMPGENGFDFLRSLGKCNYAVVFVTAYEQFAMRAIKASAVDYLLKPLHIADLLDTEKKLLAMHKKGLADDAFMIPLRSFFNNFNSSSRLQKITLHHHKGYNVVDIDQIVRLEADGNYTTLFMADMEKIVSSKPIRDFEEILDDHVFVRVHKSHMINLRYMTQYMQEDTGYVMLSGGHKVEVSRRRSAILLDRISAYSQHGKFQ